MSGRKLLKWLLPAVLVAEAGLVWSGVLELGEAVLVVAGMEILLLLVGVGGAVLVARGYRRGRAGGLSFWAALEDGLAMTTPRPVAKLAVHEPRLFALLVRWLLRGRPTGEDEFGYHKKSSLRILLPMVLFVSPVELATVHLLAHAFSPWAWLKWVLLIFGIYAIFWFLGFYASLVMLPHRLEGGGLRLRYGLFSEAFVPYPEIEAIQRKRRKSPRTGDGLQPSPGEDAVYLAVGGETNLTLRLETPLAVDGFFRRTAPAKAIHAVADEPEKLVRALEERRDVELAKSRGVPPEDAWGGA